MGYKHIHSYKCIDMNTGKSTVTNTSTRAYTGIKNASASLCNVCIIVCCIGARSSGYFNWTCANVLESSGDTFSFFGARAFTTAINGSDFSPCTVSYTTGSRAGSPDMKKTIRQLQANMDPGGLCACRVNVVFAQKADLVHLFLEAHNQNYKGEWVVGDLLLGSLADVARDLKNELEDSSVYEILQGMCELMLE